MGRPSVPGSGPRSGEFFAPLPIAALALTVVNDVWLKPMLHSALTGKLSDVGVCLFMPLFVSELLGLFFGVRPRVRLIVGGLLTAILFTAQEIVPPFIDLALRILRAIGPRVGIHGRFTLTSDWTDLFCLLLIPLSVLYGGRRLRAISDRGRELPTERLPAVLPEPGRRRTDGPPATVRL
jgi:hypothetical protein